MAVDTDTASENRGESGKAPQGKLAAALEQGGRVLLAKAIRDRAKVARRGGMDWEGYELANALARLIEGKSIYEAFGAPGDWGYDRPIGVALAGLYSVGNGAFDKLIAAAAEPGGAA